MTVVMRPAVSVADSIRSGTGPSAGSPSQTAPALRPVASVSVSQRPAASMVTLRAKPV